MLSMPIRDPGDERRRRLLVDALEVLVDPAQASEIIDRALAMAGRPDVPSIADGFGAFVEGHVLDAIESELGIDAAERFEDSLHAVLRAASVEHESAPVPSRGTQGRLVLVASTEPERVDGIARALARHADVESVETSAMPAMLWAKLATAIVIDWTRAPLDPSGIDELIASMSDGGRVVLWGAPREVEEAFVEAMSAVSPGAARNRGAWISCARGAGPAHVASLTLALLAQ